MFKNCLTGIAKVTYDDDVLSSSDKDDIDAIFDALKKEWLKTPDYYINILFDRKLQHGESIQQFQEIVELGFPYLDASALTSMLRARLVSNVPENLKIQIKCLPRTTTWTEVKKVLLNSNDYKKPSKQPDFADIYRIDSNNNNSSFRNSTATATSVIVLVIKQQIVEAKTKSTQIKIEVTHQTIKTTYTKAINKPVFLATIDRNNKPNINQTIVTITIIAKTLPARAIAIHILVINSKTIAVQNHLILRPSKN